MYYLRTWRALIGAYEAGEMPLEQVTAGVQGGVNHVRYDNTVGLRKAVLGQLVTPPARVDIERC